MNCFVTWCLALSSNFSLNCQHKFNFYFLALSSWTHDLNQFCSTWCKYYTAYDKQQRHLRSITVAGHSVWPMDFNDNKNRQKNLVTLLFSFRSIWFIWPVSVGCLLLRSVSKSQLPWSTWPWWGYLYQIRERSFKRQQSTEIKLYRLLAISSYFLD